MLRKPHVCRVRALCVRYACVTCPRLAYRIGEGGWGRALCVRYACIGRALFLQADAAGVRYASIMRALRVPLGVGQRGLACMWVVVPGLLISALSKQLMNA